MSSVDAATFAIDDEILEQALHAQVLLRCRKALLHEIRNGLQPMHAGLEAISRVVTMDPIPADKAQRYVQLVRQASASQEVALERAIERIAPVERTEQAVDIAKLLREVTRFLNSDAAVAGVRMQLDAPAVAFVRARPDRLRLIALALTVDAIDRAGMDGQLSITIHPIEDRVLLQFSDAPSPAIQPRPQARAREAFHLHVIRKLAASMGAETDCMSTPDAGLTCAITLCAAQPVAAES